MRQVQVLNGKRERGPLHVSARACACIGGKMQFSSEIVFCTELMRAATSGATEAGLSGEAKREMAIVRYGGSSEQQRALMRVGKSKGRELIKKQKSRLDYLTPEWHAPWKLYKVISGHMGWVQSVAVDPSNEWFATGAGDRTIKIWDLASGTLKLTLTGHMAIFGTSCPQNILRAWVSDLAQQHHRF